MSFFLCHGSHAKKVRGVYEAPDKLDFLLLQSDVFEAPMREDFNAPDHTQMVTLGYPRNDILFHPFSGRMQDVFEADFDKLVIWYPTFRQHKNHDRRLSSITLPVLHDAAAAQKLNDCARENNVLIVLKPHFAQDMSLINELNLSNIRIIYDSFLTEKGIPSYQLLASTDALITDYSSVYYDYLLTDKPIGLTWEDYEEFSARQGFSVDMDLFFSGGEKIYTVDEFCGFIQRLARGEDISKNDRAHIRNIVHRYHDDQSSRRVAEFLVSQLEK